MREALTMTTSQQTRSSTRPLRVVSRAQSREIDKAATDRFAIPSIVLMENASRSVAAVTIERLNRSGAQQAGDVLVICGAGNNGGDGYAAARHLHNAGCDITIIAMSEPRPDSDAALNAGVCRTMNLPIVDTSKLGTLAPKSAIIIDAMFGTGLDRDVTGEAAHTISALNEFRRPVVAVDVPSGIDCETGRVLGEAVRAAATVTFVALKPGLLAEHAQPYVGEIVVAGIGAPRELVEEHSRLPDPDELNNLQSGPWQFDPHLHCDPAADIAP